MTGADQCVAWTQETGLLELPDSPQRPCRDHALEEDAGVEGGAYFLDIGGRETESDQALAVVDEVGPSKGLHQRRMGPARAVSAKPMMLGNDERQLVRPILPADLLQPCVLRRDRRHQVVEGGQCGQVMKRCGDRELVVAVGSVWSERAGEVHDAVHVCLVAVVAGVVAVSTLAVGVEDLVDQGQGAQDLRRDHVTSLATDASLSVSCHGLLGSYSGQLDFTDRTSTMAQHALISGASIAGPALAHQLAARGWRTTVLERAPQRRDEGHNIDVRGAGREVVRRMGIEDDVRAANTR